MIAQIDELNKKAFELRASKIRESIRLSTEACELARKTGYKKGLAESLRNLGLFHTKLSEFIDLSFVESNEALEIYRELKDQPGEANTLYNLAVACINIGDYHKALENQFASLMLRRQLGDSKGEAESMNNLGFIYGKFGDHEKALEYQFKSLEIRREINDKMGEGNSLINISSIYDSMKKYDLSLKYVTESLEIKKQVNDNHGVGVCLNRIGSIYYFLDQYEKALECFLEGQKIMKVSEDSWGLSRYAFDIARTYMKKGEYERSLEYFNEALALAKQVKSKELIYDTYKAISDLYEISGKPEKALEYYRLYHAFREETWKTDATKMLDDMRTKHNAQNAEKEAEIHRLKNVELAEVLKQINDSINYAQRIQNALLPNDEHFKELMPDSFLFYQPRDVVSGDFYWLHGDHDKFLFAVVDCTGHGVPGAFMSLIGNSLLSQLVSEMEEPDPSLILLELDKKVCQILKQHDQENENHDGMDIALGLVDRKNKKLSFASAHRPVVLFHNGEMIQVKGDNFPIGGTQLSNKNFVRHDFDFNEYSLIYIFSDGFTDQFGGEKNKKYSTGRLLKLIDEMRTKTFDEQENIVSTEFNSWKGNNEQVDDVTVLGFRLL
jgi:serine phosphatase RsbU (regulator of sigma subunit)